VLQELFELWKQRNCVDEYFGTLINAWVDQGGEAFGFRAGSSYLDVGTMDGYLKTIKILSEPGNADIAAQRGAL
jgi:glucose-1-phosphate thymidylyltransferase